MPIAAGNSDICASRFVNFIELGRVNDGEILIDQFLRIQFPEHLHHIKEYLGFKFWIKISFLIDPPFVGRSLGYGKPGQRGGRSLIVAFVQHHPVRIPFPVLIRVFFRAIADYFIPVVKGYGRLQASGIQPVLAIADDRPAHIPE
ncbi:hypothetical protein D3C77_504280 [compost metagenome]